MKARNLAFAAALAALAAASPALTPRQRFAQRVVKEVIQRQYGADVAVNFQTVSDTSVAGSETTVTGHGYTKRNGPGDFDYSVRVREDASTARDAKVVFASGQRLQIAGPWRNDAGRTNVGNPQPARTVRIEKPTSGFTDLDGNVTLSGRAEGRDVLAVVSDPNGREVLRRTVSIKNGRWDTTVLLNPGSYRLAVTGDARTTSDQDSVSFNVAGASVRDEDRVVLTAPARPNDIAAGNVRFEGTGAERTVRVQIYDSRGQKIRDREATVSGGRWSSETKLTAGTYRLVLTVPSGRRTVGFDLRVR